MYEGVFPNTHARGSVQIDFPLITDGIDEHVLDVGLLYRSVLQSDHSCMFVDLLIEGIFGQHPEKLAQHQFRNLKLDDPKYPKNTGKFYTQKLNITMFINKLKRSR
jgi:hypothetical protein